MLSWHHRDICGTFRPAQEHYRNVTCASWLSHTTSYLLFDEMLNTLRPRQNGRHFADNTFKRIFLNENVRISIEISLKFVPKGPINNIPALVQIMAWHQSGDKPLSEPMMVSLLTHVCVTRPQWVNTFRLRQNGRHFAEDIFKCIFLKENVWILMKISLKFVPKVWINNIPALVQLMALYWHKYVSPQWVNRHKAPHCWPFVLGIHQWSCTKVQ